MNRLSITQSSQDDACCYLFVYGTLQRIFRHPMHRILLRYSQYAGEASIQARLFEINGYPGATISDNPAERVYGELYQITDLQHQMLFQHLDAYEECTPQFKQPHEYTRQILTTLSSENQQLHAWCYIYNHSVKGRKHIPNGHYRPS